jgi:hypothetical protein
MVHHLHQETPPYDSILRQFGPVPHLQTIFLTPVVMLFIYTCRGLSSGFPNDIQTRAKFHQNTLPWRVLFSPHVVSVIIMSSGYVYVLVCLSPISRYEHLRFQTSDGSCFLTESNIDRHWISLFGTSNEIFMTVPQKFSWWQRTYSVDRRSKSSSGLWRRVPYYNTTRHLNPKDLDSNLHRRERLK